MTVSIMALKRLLKVVGGLSSVVQFGIVPVNLRGKTLGGKFSIAVETADIHMKTRGVKRSGARPLDQCNYLIINHLQLASLGNLPNFGENPYRSDAPTNSAAAGTSCTGLASKKRFNLRKGFSRRFQERAAIP